VRGLFLLGIVMASVTAGRLQAQSFTFNPSKFCSKEHCDPFNTDVENMDAPTTAPVIRSQDNTPGGSSSGLGAVTNGTSRIVATYNTNTRSVVAYDQDGNYVCDTGATFGSSVFHSAAMVDQAGNFIVADSSHIGFYDENCNPFALTTTPGGIPTSPVYTNNGAVVLATQAGPISAYSMTTGALIGSIRPHDPGNPHYYATDNSPCVVNNRIYVSMILRDSTNTGRLYAFDIDPANAANPITVAWYYEVGGPGGASPTCVADVNGYSTVVVFDGWHLAPNNVGGPTVFAVADAGTSGVLQWATSVSGDLRTNMPSDRHGIWYWSSGSSNLHQLDISTGALLRTIRIGPMFGTGIEARPVSTMQMTAVAGSPVMLLSIQTMEEGLPRGNYLAAINTATETLVWTMAIPGLSNGQFVLLTGSDGSTEVAFTMYDLGLVVAGQPLPPG